MHLNTIILVSGIPIQMFKCPYCLPLLAGGQAGYLIQGRGNEVLKRNKKLLPFKTGMAHMAESRRLNK